jgi:hypothetical protein
VIVDPHIAILRTSDESTALYDGAMRRVAARSEQPRGVLLHYGLIIGGRFQMGTVFRDAATMTEGFVSFSAPEAQNEMRATGRSIDISRDEYQLERLRIEPQVAARPFGLVPAGDLAVASSDGAGLTIDAYHAIAEQTGWLDEPQPGRLAHLAFRVGEHITMLEFWESRQQGHDLYMERIAGPLDEQLPGVRTDEKTDAAWLALHSFVVCVPPGDPTRDFLRTAPGPQSV